MRVRKRHGRESFKFIHNYNPIIAFIKTAWKCSYQEWRKRFVTISQNSATKHRSFGRMSLSLQLVFYFNNQLRFPLLRYFKNFARLVLLIHKRGKKINDLKKPMFTLQWKIHECFCLLIPYQAKPSFESFIRKRVGSLIVPSYGTLC